jgi:uncharacterized membrane protein
MFTKTRERIRVTVASIKAAFNRLITTIESATASINTLRDEQKELREKLDAISTHTKFLVDQKRAELHRAGQKVA